MSQRPLVSFSAARTLSAKAGSGGQRPPRQVLITRDRYCASTLSFVAQELIVRWYQFGTFCPVFRTHGCRSGASEPAVAPCIGVSGSCGFNEVRTHSRALRQMRTAPDAHRARSWHSRRRPRPRAEEPVHGVC